MKIEEERKKTLKLFCKSLHIRFNSLSLLNTALTHKSYQNENRNIKNNERLEFLGDSILGFVITEYLYAAFPESAEGVLARIKSFVVSEEVLSKIAKDININEYILISRGEENSGGRDKKTIMADSFEAFLGAYYLDGSLMKVRSFILFYLMDEIDMVVNNKSEKDYKSLLQELIQKKHKVCPTYILLDENGPEHDKTFVMEVTINDKKIGHGEGKSKKDAEKNAAKNAYLKITSKHIATNVDKNNEKVLL